jgi:hypothetical protein
MLARPTLKKPDQEDATPAKGQARPTEERFLLRVDGQIKRSFDSREPALTVARAIKKAFPVVAVSIMDAEDGTTEIINAQE